MSKLFTPYNLSGLALKNRVVMAPMTRTRTMNDVPDEVVALYYAQRASAGLLITEGMPVSEEGRGYLYTPGIYNDEHVQGWRKVTQAVHAKGGRIFAQLWHVGRMSHVSLQPGHIAPVSAGTVQAVNTTVFALTESGEPGPVVPSQPRALETHEVKRITADFVHSARLAMEAGFDGVEIMAANGFIFDQFLSSELNTRTDEYGGSFENRFRFPVEIVQEIKRQAGADFPVSLRYSVVSKTKAWGKGAMPYETDFEEFGRDMAESEKAVKYLEEAGYDQGFHKMEDAVKEYVDFLDNGGYFTYGE